MSYDRFFEDEELVSTELYTPKVHEEILNGEPEFEEKLIMKFENGKFEKTRVRLFNNLITFTDNEGNDRFVYLSFIRNKYNVEENNSNKYRIDLMKFSRVLSFYTDKLETVQKWMDKLSKYCVNSNFYSKYEIKEVLGKGGFGMVYRVVFQDDPTKEFAAKVFQKKEIKRKFKSLLHWEIKILQMMNNERIVKIFEVHETGDELVVIMELMRHGLLSTFISQNQKMHPTVIREIMRQLIAGLEYMASFKVIHRDIKPDNILIEKFESRGGLQVPHIKICDLGVACFEDQEPEFIFAGTAGYIAPEVYNAEQIKSKRSVSPEKNKKTGELLSKASIELTSKVDMYSSGVIFYRLITGRSPFNVNGMSVEEANELGKISFDSMYITKFCKQGVDLLKKMLDQKPKTRISASVALAHDYFLEEDVSSIDKTKSSRKIQLDQSPEKVERERGSIFLNVGKELARMRSRSFN